MRKKTISYAKNMQVFDLKVVESLGLPVEVIDGVPCIIASGLDFTTVGNQSMNITVPEHTAADFYNALLSFLGVRILDSMGEIVTMTNVSKDLFSPLVRGLYMPRVKPGQIAKITDARYVSINRLNSTTITIYATDIKNA